MTDITKQLAFQLRAAANYIEALGGVSTSYRQALAAYEAQAEEPKQELGILACEIKPRPLPRPLADYHRAISEGPLHYTWQDKPHRLVYDLIAAIRYYAAPVAQDESEWLPIETAPDDTPVVVAWFESDRTPHHDFDIKEDGCWMRWHDHAEHVEIIGGHGVSYTPPYSHWMPLPQQPKENP